MYHEYPYTTYYSDVDKICGACHACGLRLVIQGDYLRLVDGKGNVLSNVQVSYAEKAAFDKDGKAIEAYIFDVSEDGTHIVFTRGDGTYKTITVPYSEKAAKDLQGKDILNYSYALSISGDKLRITKGDGSVYELTIPYAVKASEDSEGKDITTYAATLEVDGDEVVLRDSKGRQLSRITVPYADEAAQAEEANHALAADHALEADEADHATDADTADYATLSTDATNAIESLVITGDQLVATTYGGTQVTLTIPYAVKAQKDDAGNVIKTTYVANVAQDSQTGEISFYDATGAVITSLVPTASVATYDSYGNTIADYIKTITVTQGSDYVTVVHGTGTTDSIKIDYSTRAWKDTNNNVIKNFYVSYLECVEDVDDGHYKLVWYDGDNPRAELGRCEVWAYKAQVDVNDKALTSYVADVNINANKEVVVKDGEGNTLNTFDTIKNAVYAEKDVNNHNITGYVKYIDTNTSDTLLRVHDGDNNVYTINAPSVQVTVTSTVAPSSFNNTNFSSSAVSCNYDDFSVLNGIGDTATAIVRYNNTDYFARVKTQDQVGGNNKTIFEAELTSGGLWQIELVTTPQGAFVSCTGNYITVSGGGGGGSVTTYYLYNEWGSAATFSSLTTANNCVLKDSSSSTDVSISTLATAFAAGTVYIEDADGAKTRVLSLGYNSGSVRYFYMLMPSSTASAKLRSCDWSSNKYYMTNVNL